MYLNGIRNIYQVSMRLRGRLHYANPTSGNNLPRKISILHFLLQSFEQCFLSVTKKAIMLTIGWQNIVVSNLCSDSTLYSTSWQRLEELCYLHSGPISIP